MCRWRALKQRAQQGAPQRKVRNQHPHTLTHQRLTKIKECRANPVPTMLLGQHNHTDIFLRRSAHICHPHPCKKGRCASKPGMPSEDKLPLRHPSKQGGQNWEFVSSIFYARSPERPFPFSPVDISRPLPVL